MMVKTFVLKIINNDINMMKRILLIAGRAESGKDTVADFLVSHYNYTKFAFADELKTLVPKKYSIDKTLMYTHSGKKSKVINKNYTIRDLLIKESDSITNDYPNHWVDIVCSKIDQTDTNIVISDFRYEREYNRMVERFASVETMIIIRKDIELIEHPSENSLNSFSFNYILYNDSDLSSLFQKVINILA